MTVDVSLTTGASSYHAVLAFPLVLRLSFRSRCKLYQSLRQSFVLLFFDGS